MNKKVAIRVDNLVKTFKIPTEASNGIKQKLINVLKGKKGYREFTPLKGISFETPGVFICAGSPRPCGTAGRSRPEWWLRPRRSGPVCSPQTSGRPFCAVH